MSSLLAIVRFSAFSTGFSWKEILPGEVAGYDKVTEVPKRFHLIQLAESSFRRKNKPL